jgi:hypothetical protein
MSGGRAGVDTTPISDRSGSRSGTPSRADLDAYAPMLPPTADAATGTAAETAEDRFDRLFDPAALKDKPQVSKEATTDRIREATGLTDGLPDEQLLHTLHSGSTRAGIVFADRDTFRTARAGATNIVTDAAELVPEPDAYVFQSSGTREGPDYAPTAMAGDIALQILNDRYYQDGTDIKVSFPLDPEDAAELARATQARVFVPPEGHLARRGADDSLVVVSADEYGFGGPPYPSGSTEEWVVIHPPARWW